MAVTQWGKRILLPFKCWDHELLSHWLSLSKSLWFSQTMKAKDSKKTKKIVGIRPSDMFIMHYSSQGEVCIMGMKRIFQKLKGNVRCVKARDQYISQMSDSCPCTEADFEWWVPCSAATLFTSLNPMNAQHFINLQRQSLWSKPKAQQEESLKTYLIIHYLFLLYFYLRNLRFYQLSLLLGMNNLV